MKLGKENASTDSEDSVQVESFEFTRARNGIIEKERTVSVTLSRPYADTYSESAKCFKFASKALN